MARGQNRIVCMATSINDTHIVHNYLVYLSKHNQLQGFRMHPYSDNWCQEVGNNSRRTTMKLFHSTMKDFINFLAFLCSTDFDFPACKWRLDWQIEENVWRIQSVRKWSRLTIWTHIPPATYFGRAHAHTYLRKIYLFIYRIMEILTYLTSG